MFPFEQVSVCIKTLVKKTNRLLLDFLERNKKQTKLCEVFFLLCPDSMWMFHIGILMHMHTYM